MEYLDGLSNEDDEIDQEEPDQEESDHETREEVSTKKRWGNNAEPLGEPIVLEPDHELMQKFQHIYKKHLVKENERLDGEILELKANLKKRKQDYEKQMSHEMYHLEQEVSYQRKVIREYETALENASKEHIEKESAVKRSREMYKEKVEMLNSDKKKDAELLTELEALTLLCKQYESWQKETDSELAVNQRISEKLAIEKKALSEEKKQSDLMVYKLTTEVWNLESRLELLEEQIQIKNEELENIRDRCADSQADLEALQVEQNHLIKLWSSVVVNIGKKDKIYADVQKDIVSVKAEIQTVIANIESCKKDTLREMQRNEELTRMKENVTYRLTEIKKAIQKEENKRQAIETSLMEASETFEMTEKDLSVAKGENYQLQSKFKNISVQNEKFIDEKIRLENETLDKLQEKLSCDKRTESIAVQIRQLKEKSRKEEINILTNENKNAKVIFQIERQKMKNLDLITQIAAEKKINEEKESELISIENKIKECLRDIDKMQINFDTINRKISARLEKMDGREISPVERKIEELEGLIEDQANVNYQMQENWLRMQGHIMNLTAQLQSHTSEIDSMKDQIRILENKKMKLDNKINGQRQENTEMKRILEGLQNQVNRLSKTMYQNKEQNIELEAKYNALTVEYSAKLKMAESDALAAEEELTALEDDKVQFANDLHKSKREAISWQKMVLMAAETREKVNRERTSGDVNQMKSEIHRMQVRKGQLATAAARLASDLELAVERRSAVVHKARASTKSTAPRHTVVNKIKEKRVDIRRLNQEIQINKSLIENSVEERKTLQKDLDENRARLNEMESELGELRKHIFESQLLKQKNLETIIRHQSYGKHCSAILSGRSRSLSSKSESAIDVEYEKQKKINSQLKSAVEKLLVDLPDQNLSLKRVLNTLNVEEEETRI